MEIHTSDQPGEALVRHLIHAIESHGGTTLCLLAGGSALQTYKKINLSNNTKGRTIFCMGDERVSGEASVNNYLQLQTVAPYLVQNYHVINTSPEEAETCEIFSKRISNELEKIISSSENVQIFSVQGMGEDGHTASIFPMDEESFRTTYERDSHYVPVHVEGLTIDSRASITPSFILNHVSELILFAAGENKKTKLNELVHEEKDLFELPVGIVKKHTNAHVFTDQEMQP